jgi:hypothetical protein
MDTKRILAGLYTERKRIDQAIVALEALNPASTHTPDRSGSRRRMSAAGRRKISNMMKARWAARRKAAGKTKS